MEQVDDRDQPVAERRTDGRTHDIQRRIADEKIVACLLYTSISQEVLQFLVQVAYSSPSA